MADYFLADDLSGALDAAAGFHHAGHRVTLALTPEAWPQREDGIVAITTETRNLPAATAAAIVTETLTRARERGLRLIYKKIDSTLRGAVAAELAAVQAAFPGVPILFSPANLRVGRAVRGGKLFVYGVPVAETEYAHDPVSPVRESDLRALLGAAAKGVEIPDVESEADLTAAARRMPGDSWIAVGSGALARVVATRCPPAPRRVSEAALPRGPILFVGGSAHPGNRAQATLLSHEQGVPLHEVSVGAPQQVENAVADSLEARGAAALLLEPERRESSAALATIVAAARTAIERAGVRHIFVTGGETAYALCRALGITTLDYRDEIETGLSLSQAGAGESARRFAIKPGGFGDARTWLRAYATLRA